jgi:cation:H+ antiporter
MLIGFIIFIYFIIQQAQKQKTIITNSTPNTSISKQQVSKTIALIIVGIAGLYLGGEYFVEYAVKIAHQFGMSDQLIGLTIIAIGTSLPLRKILI